MKKTARHAIRELSLIFRNAALVTLAVVLGFVVGDALEFPVWAQGLFLLPAVLLAYRLSGERRPALRRLLGGICLISGFTFLFSLGFKVVPEDYRSSYFLLFPMLFPFLAMTWTSRWGFPAKEVEGVAELNRKE